MAGRDIKPLRFSPRGAVDSLDGGQVSEGGCAALTNLIFDPTTPLTMQCRPAAVIPNGGTAIPSSGGPVSIAAVVGEVIYGMRGSSSVSGYDTPFAYNLTTNTFVTVGGTQTASTLPISQPTTGDWTPPTSALVGVNLVVTHPGFLGGSAVLTRVTGTANQGGLVKLTVGSTTGFSNYDTVTVSGVGGTTEANGTHSILSIVDATHMIIIVAYVHAYTSGGIVQKGTAELITGAADNGSGLIRLTVTSASGFSTGNTAVVSGVLGTTEANGTWTVTYIDSTHIDLQGTSFVNAWSAGGTQVIALEGAFFGWIDTTNPAAPTWNAGNTTTTGLVAVPTAVAQFNARAWFAVGNNVVFTDPLALNVALASDAITIGDSLPITALAPQPVTTSVQGVIQALAVFKPETLALITGDSADQNLSSNVITSAIGCAAGRTIAPTAKGLIFVANDGVRVLKQDGALSDANQDLRYAFINAASPSRMSGAYNNGIYRVSLNNGNVGGSPAQEYWLDVHRNGWTGPHAFVQTVACPYKNTFIVFNNSATPYVWQSDVIQSGASTFTEAGTALTFNMQTATLPDGGGLYENSAILTTADLALPASGGPITFTATDITHGTLSSVEVPAGAVGVLERYNVPWDIPLVFSRLQIAATGNSSAGIKIGKIIIGYQPLNYVRTP